VILRSLMDCNNEANESILQDCLDAYGHNVSRDVVRGQIDWLACEAVNAGRAALPGAALTKNTAAIAARHDPGLLAARY
ncbi:hypothetical protein MJH54_33250, partial [Salmonella enterica subsp. enterica serovar Montevideo]|nr:hypothetical protein [Salmonella enterica subsp. enterica serovar Montevideo]